MSFKLHLIAFSVASCAVLATQGAQAAPNAKKTFERGMECREIGGAAERLLCYDQAFENDIAVSQVMAEKEIVVATVTPPTQEELEDDFGAEFVPSKRREKIKIDNLTSAIVNVDKGAFGKLTVTLENGQIWRQLDSDKKIMLTSSKRAVNAEIERAALGSYRLRIEPLGKTIRVQRVE